MEQSITFNGTDYTLKKLEAAETDELLALRNQIADNLGVAKVRQFSDHGTAVKQTWKALEKFEKTCAEEAAGGEPKPQKAKKAPKEKGPYVIPKSAQAKVVKRPTRQMFSTIAKTGEHTGEQGRQARWPNYKDGMTLVDIEETDGTEQWDVKNWVKHGIMSVTEPTDEEYEARRAAWYKKHGLTDPEVAKIEEAKAKEAAKAEREAEREAKRKAREEAKAKREAEKAEKAKAKAEADAAKAKAEAK